MLGKYYILTRSMALAVSDLQFHAFPHQLSVLHATFITLRYAASETQIRLERMACLTLWTLAFDGGRLCMGAAGCAAALQLTTPRH